MTKIMGASVNRSYHLPAFLGVLYSFVAFSDIYSAEIPVVAFDAPMVVSCRELPHSSKTSKSKLIEAIFKITSSVEAGSESDIVQLEYSISDDKPKKTLQVLEFLPKTEVYTDIVDPIVVVETVEDGVSGQLSATYRTLPAKSDVTAEGGVKGQYTSKGSVQYKKLPPKSVLVASGTKERRHAVFFKMKPSTQATFETERTFSVIFQVSKDWRGDWVYLKCEATGVKRHFFSVFDSQVPSGLAGYAIGLHLKGDDNAKTAAEEIAKKQQELFNELAKTRDAKSWLNIALEWIWFLNKLSAVQGATATNAQLHGILKTKPFAEVKKELPPSVKERLEALNTAKMQIEKLSGVGEKPSH